MNQALAANQAALASVTTLPVPPSSPATPGKPLMQSTDGQGVVLLTGRATDARQRTPMDLLARRLAHRLGCPVVIAETAQGFSQTSSAVDRLRQRGAHQIAIVPLRPTQRRPIGAGKLTTPTQKQGPVTMRLAEDIWSDTGLIDAAAEALDLTERPPHPDTAVVVATGQLPSGAVAAQDEHLRGLLGTAWGAASVLAMPADPAGCVKALEARVAGLGCKHTLVLPLSLYPDLTYRTWESATRALGPTPGCSVEFVPTTVHGTAAVVELLRLRVLAARRK